MEYKGKVFVTTKEAARITGLSCYSLRAGIKSGSVPHIMSGNRFLINVPLLLDNLYRESGGNVKTEKA